MSIDQLNKENAETKLCSECLSKGAAEHVCSSQLFSDAHYTLAELATSELKQFEHFSFESNYLKCKDELHLWYQSALEHLQELFERHSADLLQIAQEQLQSDLTAYRKKLIEQLEKKINPTLQQMIEKSHRNRRKAEQIKGILQEIQKEAQILTDHPWIHLHLPDLKHFSVPIRIAKMALAARLTDGEKDPLDDLSDDDNAKEQTSEKNGKSTDHPKKIPSVDLIELFAKNAPPWKSYPLESNSSTLAFSSAHILLHDNKKLLLFDLQKKQKEWLWNDNDSGILVDICWMPIIAKFLILTIHSLYQLDPNKDFHLPTSKIEQIKLLDRTYVFASLAAFDRDLFLNYHKGVHLDHYQLNSFQQFHLLKRYSKSECSELKDIGIRDIRSNHQHLCLSIMQSDDFKWRLDLMSPDLIRVRRGVPMDSGENQHKFFSMLIPIGNQSWLFVNWFTNKLWLVDQQGKTRLLKENQMKNIRNIALSQQQNYLAVRLEKPSLLNIFQLALS